MSCYRTSSPAAQCLLGRSLGKRPTPEAARPRPPSPAARSHLPSPLASHRQGAAPAPPLRRGVTAVPQVQARLCDPAQLLAAGGGAPQARQAPPWEPCGAGTTPAAPCHAAPCLPAGPAGTARGSELGCESGGREEGREGSSRLLCAVTPCPPCTRLPPTGSGSGQPLCRCFCR
jgi:hypothetical protein